MQKQNDSKQNDLRKFRSILELFHQDTEEIKPNNEEQKKDLEKEKLCLLQLLIYMITF